MQSHKVVPSSAVAGRKRRPNHKEPPPKRSHNTSRCDSRPNYEGPNRSRKGKPGWRKRLDKAIAEGPDEELSNLLKAFRIKLDGTDEDEIDRHGGTLYGNLRLCANDVCGLVQDRFVTNRAMDFYTQLPASERKPGICALTRTEMIELDDKARGPRVDAPDSVFAWEHRMRRSACAIGPLYVDGHSWVVLEARTSLVGGMSREVTFNLYHNYDEVDTSSDSPFWGDTSGKTEKIFLYMARLLLGTEVVNTKPEFIHYPQQVSTADTGLAAVVLTMDRYSAFPSNEGFLCWEGNPAKSRIQSLWLRKRLASKLSSEPTTPEGTCAEEINAERETLPLRSGPPSPPSPLPDPLLRSLDVEPEAKQSSSSALPLPSSRSLDVEPEAEQELEACPEPKIRSLRRRTAPKTAYDMSVHPQDEELGLSRARRVQIVSSRPSICLGPPLRLLRSLRTARLLGPNMAESSNQPLNDHLDPGTQNRNNPRTRLLAQSESQNSAGSATKSRRLSSRIASK